MFVITSVLQRKELSIYYLSDRTYSITN